MTATLSPQALNEQYGIPHTLRFESAPGGRLVRAVVTGDAATGVIYLYGAQVAEYQPVGHKPVLFMSRQAHYREGQPIRGGIPICFPWFGRKEGEPGAPAHGTVRTKNWDFKAARKEGDNLVIDLTTAADHYELLYSVSFGAQLTLKLKVTNTGPFASSFEEALHTYFAVSQIRQTEVLGLKGHEYLDKTQNFTRSTQGADPLEFAAETDRIYPTMADNCVIRDPGLHRRIKIEKGNAHSTVVWNPWDEKAVEMDDLADDEWATFVCVETGNIADSKVTLEPTQSHEMSTTITVEKV
ncbi:MAG: D-hexose-6-phosphate mutarotase [Phycisphaeraceae bacterium]